MSSLLQCLRSLLPTSGSRRSAHQSNTTKLARHWMYAVATIIACGVILSPALGQNVPSDLQPGISTSPLPAPEFDSEPEQLEPMDINGFVTSGPEQWLSREGLSSSLQTR